MKRKNNEDVYAYQLRFNRRVPLDQKALDKISQFCDITHMTMRDAIIFMLAVTDVSALNSRLMSLTVSSKVREDVTLPYEAEVLEEKAQGTIKTDKNPSLEKRADKTLSSIDEMFSEGSGSVFDDILGNF